MVLPANGVTIEFDGSGAVVSGLKTWGRYYFSVRAMNRAGVSEWSEYNDMDSEGGRGRTRGDGTGPVWVHLTARSSAFREHVAGDVRRASRNRWGAVSDLG